MLQHDRNGKAEWFGCLFVSAVLAQRIAQARRAAGGRTVVAVVAMGKRVAYVALIEAQDQLNSNAAFLPERFYNAYEGSIIPQSEKESLPHEAYKRISEINAKFKQLNSELREYLDELDVIE